MHARADAESVTVSKIASFRTAVPRHADGFPASQRRADRAGPSIRRRMACQPGRRGRADAAGCFGDPAWPQARAAGRSVSSTFCPLSLGRTDARRCPSPRTPARRMDGGPWCIYAGSSESSRRRVRMSRSTSTQTPGRVAEISRLLGVFPCYSTACHVLGRVSVLSIGC